jgi:hypothetical protein
VIHQGGQARERRTVGESRLDGVETRNLQAGNQFGIERRQIPMVGARPLSTEVQTGPESLSSALQMLESWHQDARRAACLTEGQVCAHIGNGKGGTYDPSQWNEARKAGNWPIGRMLAGCPDAYLDSLAIDFARSRGMHVSHSDLADQAVARVAIAFEAVAEAFRHMRRTA